MRILALMSLPALLASAPAGADEVLPQSGFAKLAAYLVCRPLSVVDMGGYGSESATECNGILKNLDGPKAPDNLAIRCLEYTSSQPGAYKYLGTCTQTDSDGDKLYMTYEGAQSGQVRWIGGAGKYKDVNGSGNLAVVPAPGNTPSQFAYTLNYDITWTNRPK